MERKASHVHSLLVRMFGENENFKWTRAREATVGKIRENVCVCAKERERLKTEQFVHKI